MEVVAFASAAVVLPAYAGRMFAVVAVARLFAFVVVGGWGVGGKRLVRVVCEVWMQKQLMRMRKSPVQRRPTDPMPVAVEVVAADQS